MARDQARILFGVVAFFVIWEFFGRFTGWGVAMLPAPSRILAQAWTDRELYLAHGASTIQTSVIGFLFGSAIAILAALLFCAIPGAELLFRGVNVALFAMPAIVVGPLLVLLFAGNLPQIILAALMVYFPAMSATLLGLKEIDPRLAALIETYGGREWALMRFVRLRSALPMLFAGLRVAAPLAVLGAILGEFGSGTRWGFGSFLLSALPQGNPARLWGIGLASSAIALAGYGLFLLPSRWLAGTSGVVTLSVARATQLPAGSGSRLGRAALLAGAVVLPFFLWWLVLVVTKLSPIIAPSPFQTFHSLFGAAHADKARAAMGHALGQTLPMAALGLLAELGVAFVLAALSVLTPKLARALMPVALVAQNMPLVALVPLIVLVFGRGVAASVFMAVLVVFFPAYVMLVQGFAMVPKPARDLVSAYGGSRWKLLTLVSVQSAMPQFFAAARLVAPQALLGVMVAEWLLSGIGLGNLLNISRGQLDYDMIWAGATVSILISVVAYEVVGVFERIVSR